MKYDDVANLYLSMMLHEDADMQRKLQVADIGHHHVGKFLVEQNISDWVNHKQPWEHQLNDFNMTTSVHGMNKRIKEQPDLHQDLADEHAANLDSHHKESVHAYINGGLEDGHDSGSKFVNDHLIRAHKSGKAPKKEFTFGPDPDYATVLNVDDLDHALKQNKLEKPLTTYSGIGFNPQKLMKDNGLVHLPAYTSSSTHRGVALMYANADENSDYHVLQIKHPAGSTGLYIGDNERFSSFAHKEHLMPRGSNIKINPTPEIHTDNLGNKIHVWKATRLLDKQD